MKRVYLIALGGTALIFAVVMLMKSPAVVGHLVEVTKAPIVTTNSIAIPADTGIRAEVSTPPKTTIKFASENNSAAVIDATTDSIVADITTDNSNLNTEADDATAMSLELQNYNEING